MPRVIPPPLSLALTYLRTARGWTQLELAEAAGMTNQVICRYETSRRRLLKLETLESLVALMGYEPADVSLALLFLGGLSPAAKAARRSPVEPSPAELRRAKEMAARVGLTEASRLHAELLDAARGHRAKRARHHAACLWESLRRCSPAKQRQLVETSPEYQAWAFAELLCAESVDAAADDAARALRLARLALRVAELAPGDDEWRGVLQGYCRAFVANAQRVGNDLRGAAASFATAWKLWRAGGGDTACGPLAGWRLRDLEASLLRDRRQFAAALEALEAVLRGAPAGAKGRILLKKAATLEQAGDAKAAVATLDEAAPLVDAAGGARDRFGLRFNRIVLLCHLGRHGAAEDLLPELGELAAALENHLDLLRYVWLTGRVAAGLGRRDKARSVFEQARLEFAELKQGYDAALVGMELAILQLEEGRSAEVAALAEQMLCTFKALEVHREALAALGLFCQAVRGGTATPELARRMLDYLERARRDPQLRFEEAA